MAHLRNKHLADMTEDHFLHLGFSSNSKDVLTQHFSEIKFVVMSGSQGRAEKFAKRLSEEMNLEFSGEPIGSTDRYHIYKVSHVLVVSHGIGGPSLSVLLNELTKTLVYAGSKDFQYIRTGTCGGIGAPPGALVVSNQVYNGGLEPHQQVFACGKSVKREAKFNQHLTKQVAAAGERLGLPTIVGATVCCDDYFEAQGRLDGIICEYSKEDRDEFLNKCHKLGCRNMEMEGLQLAAFCHSVAVPAAMVCVSFIDRLRGDQVRSKLSNEELSAFAQRPYDAVIEFLKQQQQD